MVAIETASTLLLAGVASFFMAWSIGAGSSGSTPFAPAVGADAISILRAAFVVGILGLAGATLQGANVTEAVGRELILGTSITPAAATVGLLIAALLVAIGVFTGYPIATAFTVTGAMIGVGLALGGDPAWSKYREIGALWLLTPIAGGAAAYGVARLLRHRSISTRSTITVLGGFVGTIVANVEVAAIGPDGGAASIASVVGGPLGGPVVSGIDSGAVLVSLLIAVGVGLVLYRDLGRGLETAQRRFLLAMGALVAFSAGGSQVGLAIGPLLPLLGDLPFELSMTTILFAGGLGLLVGSWTGAPRMIKALSQDYSALGPNRSIAALIPSFVIAQTAVFFGIPVSFNEIIVSAIVGSGYAVGTGGVSGAKMGKTILVWVGSLVLAFAGSFGVYAAIATLI